MRKLFKQEDSKSCGKVSLMNMFQLDYIEVDYQECQDLVGITNTIRNIIDKGSENDGLFTDTAFYNHEGVEQLPAYLDTYVKEEDFTDEIEGIPFLIHTKGKVPELNHIFLAVRKKDGWDIYDGLKDDVISVRNVQEMNEKLGHFGYYGVYFVRNREGIMLTWFNVE